MPLGGGLLDLPKMVATIRAVRPATNFSLEMITRDPLKVPCLTEKYWVAVPDRNGRFLARTLKLVREHASKNPLPVVSQLPREERSRLEEDNIRACLRYAREMWGRPSGLPRFS